MSANSAPPNVETALQLRARLHEALDAFKQIADLAIDHYIHQQQDLPDGSSREPDSAASLDETLSEINKITHVIVKTTWSARAICDGAGIAQSSVYVPLTPPAERSRTSTSPQAPSSTDSSTTTKIETEVHNSAASQTKGTQCRLRER
jgi:hypothetical protein